MCRRVLILGNRSPSILFALWELWRGWVSLAVGCWTGEPGPRALKLAPLFVPPFRTLFLNENGDFFPGSPPNILRHSTGLVRPAMLRAGDSIRETVRNALFRAKDVTCACALRGVARLLRTCRYAHRSVFPRLHGNEALYPMPDRPAGDGIDYFHQNGAAWKAELLEQLAKSSGARWILWQQDRVTDATPEMEALFADPQAFAVSLQTHYRAWKPALLPMAPFQTLQPGAATQVLAPLSDAILVDRQKLLALGIPRCGLAGTAWMILFWKAAAAGWRSYSLGQGGALREQHDFPAEEAAFFFHMLRRPGLRRLGPREPELSRGTVAFAPALRRRHSRLSGRPRVLVVSPFLPYPLSHGGAVRIYNLCRALSGQVDFALAAIREKHDVVDYDKLHEIFRQVSVVDVDELPSRDSKLPGQVRHTQSRSLRALIARIAGEWNPDVLQIEYTHMAAFRNSAPDVPAILVEHDLTFTLYRQLAEKGHGAEAWREYERWQHFERHWLRTFDSVWTVSEEDRRIAVNQGSRLTGTHAIPNGVDTVRFRPWDKPAGVAEILYVGSFRHLPNVLGFEKLRCEVMPEVWKRHPQARLRVVAGPRHEDYWKGGSELDPRIAVHGFVEDLRPLYAAASVVVVPLEVSAGTNIKVLEAMACGKAIVTTPAGCAGLGLTHRHDAWIESEWRGYGAAVAGLLSDPDLRRRLALEARRTAEAGFDWNAIAGRALERYEEMIESNSPRLRQPWGRSPSGGSHR
jgi:glycosyltransferase involved in cell wall biosynthesis